MPRPTSLLRRAVVLGTCLLAASACTTSTGEPTATPDVAPAASASTRPVVLLAAGDIACDPASPAMGSPNACQQGKVGALVRRKISHGADWWMPLGDLQYEDGTYKAFRAVYDKAFGAVRSVTQPIAGNHEWHTTGAAGYFQYFGRRAGTAGRPWRTFVAAPGWRVVLLDSNCEKVGGCDAQSPQGRWLRRTLHRAPQRCTIAAWHHPLQTSGEYRTDTGTKDRARPLWRIADRGGVDIVLNGHDHIYERFAKLGGVQEFLVGSGGKSHYNVTQVTPGSMFRNDHDYGVLRLSLRSGRSYSWGFLTLDGRVLDRGQGTCTNRPAR